MDPERTYRCQSHVLSVINAFTLPGREAYDRKKNDSWDSTIHNILHQAGPMKEGMESVVDVLEVQIDKLRT